MEKTEHRRSRERSEKEASSSVMTRKRKNRDMSEDRAVARLKRMNIQLEAFKDSSHRVFEKVKDSLMSLYPKGHHIRLIDASSGRYQVFFSSKVSKSRPALIYSAMSLIRSLRIEESHSFSFNDGIMLMFTVHYPLNLDSLNLAVETALKDEKENKEFLKECKCLRVLDELDKSEMLLRDAKKDLKIIRKRIQNGEWWLKDKEEALAAAKIDEMLTQMQEPIKKLEMKKKYYISKKHHITLIKAHVKLHPMRIASSVTEREKRALIRFVQSEIPYSEEVE